MIILDPIIFNPASTRVKINLSGDMDGVVKYQINDFAGRLLISKDLGKQTGSSLQTEIYLGKLAKGTYLLRIWVGEKMTTRKLVIQ